MKITSFLAEKFQYIYKKDTFLKILSLIIAISLWFAISINEYPTMKKTIINIPIKINLEGTKAEANMLQITEQSDEVAILTIEGERNQIGKFEDEAEESLEIFVDVSNISVANTYKLPLELNNISGKKFEVISIEPSSISLTFEKIISKEFDVKAKIGSGITIDSGYMPRDPIITSSSKLTITGPQAQVESITDVYVYIEQSDPIVLSSSREFTSSNIHLFNNNVEINEGREDLTFDRSSFTVQVPVYTTQSIPLDISINNVPEGFETEAFKEKIKLSTDTLEIAVPTNKIINVETLSIGTISMREIDVGSSFEFNIENLLPEGYENLSGVSTVTVTCPSDGLSKKPVAIRGGSINITNQLSNYNYELITSTIMPNLVGPEEEINNIMSTDLICTANMLSSDRTVDQPGDYKVPVEFEIKNHPNVWINSGSATITVYVRVTEKNAE